MPIVLLAHSDSQRRDTLGAALRAKGFEVRAVADVEAALDAAAETTPGVLLIEPKLLQDEEFEVSTRLELRASRPVRILVLSHRADPAEMALFKKHGAGLIAKPPEDVERLAVTIRVQMEQADEAASKPSAPWERGGGAPPPSPEPPKLSKKARAKAEKLLEQSGSHKKAKGKDKEKSDSRPKAKGKVPEPPKPTPPPVTPSIPPSDDPTEPEAHTTRETPIQAPRTPADSSSEVWSALRVPSPPSPGGWSPPPPPTAPIDPFAPASPRAPSIPDDPFAVEGDIDVGGKTGFHVPSAPAAPRAKPPGLFDADDEISASSSDPEESLVPPIAPASSPFADPFDMEGDIDDFGAKTSAYDADALKAALDKKAKAKSPPPPRETRDKTALSERAPRETRDKTALAEPLPRESREKTKLSPEAPAAPAVASLASLFEEKTGKTSASPDEVARRKTGTTTPAPTVRTAPDSPVVERDSDSNDHLFTQVMEGIDLEPDGATPTEQRPVTAPAAPAPPPMSAREFLADIGNGSGPTVLLVDDDPAFRGFLRDSLTENGYVVHTAINASNAIRFLKSGITIHLVISDLHMPHMDGFELKHEIDRIFPKPMPFIVVTADTSDEKIQTAAQVGASALVPKPIEDMDAFYAILLDTLRDAGLIKKQ